MSSYGSYEVFELDDLGFIFSEIHGHLMHAYSCGLTEARVFIRSTLAYSYIIRWMPGWVRKAPPGGVWRNSRGDYYSNLLTQKLFLSS